MSSYFYFSETPDAIYGFSPNPESERLGSFLEYDWTDPEWVAESKKNRIASKTRKKLIMP
jgi:hypothetical protein